MKKILIPVCVAVGALLAGVILLRAGVFGPVAPAAPSPTPVPAATPSPTPEPTPTPTPEPTPSPTPTPTPTPTPETEAERYVLSFVGDCTLASSQHSKGAAGSFEKVVGDDLSWPFAATKQYFENDYLSIANMEGTFTDATTSSGGTFTFKSDAKYAGIFTEGSIELVTLGNNHAGDYKEQGRKDTKAALEAAGVLYADEDGTCLYQSGDGPVIGVYAKLFPTAAQVRAGVQKLKNDGAEFIIAALHWGKEGSYRPNVDQITAGQAAIDAGADLVYGSHPHVLQKAEEYGGGWIFYSLGNWSFGGNTNPRDRDTAIIQVTVVRGADGSLSVEKVDMIPCKLSGSDAANDYQPQPYEAGTEEYERAMSKLLGTYDGPDFTPDYSAFEPAPSASQAPVDTPNPSQTQTPTITVTQAPGPTFNPSDVPDNQEVITIPSDGETPGGTIFLPGLGNLPDGSIVEE